MINCKEAVRIASENKDRPISFRQRMALWFHLTLCAMCRTYRGQIELISRLSRHAGTAVMHADGAPALSEDCKRRIKDELTK